MKTSEILAVNGPTYNAIDKIIRTAAREYATRREAGSSDSMNGALEYVTDAVCKAICDAAGEEIVWARVVR